MIKQIFNWLRKDDQRLDPLRQRVQQQERPIEWDQLQEICLYLIYLAVIMGFGAMVAFWIMA